MCIRDRRTDRLTFWAEAAEAWNRKHRSAASVIKLLTEGKSLFITLRFEVLRNRSLKIPFVLCTT